MPTQTIAATGEKVGKYRWTIVALLFFATTVDYLDRQVSLLQPTLAEKYNWTNNDYANITSVSIAHLMMLVKGESSKWINNQKISSSVFRWQESYGAFSYDRSQVKAVATYIENQEQHHRKKTFLEEYKNMLENLKLNMMNDIFSNSLNDFTCMQCQLKRVLPPTGQNGHHAMFCYRLLAPNGAAITILVKTT